MNKKVISPRIESILLNRMTTIIRKQHFTKDELEYKLRIAKNKVKFGQDKYLFTVKAIEIVLKEDYQT